MSMGEATGELSCQPAAEPVARGGFAKRAFDISVAGALLLFLAPVMLLIAALIWLRDPGPIFYGQQRIGFDERRFKCLKFRSMVVNSADVLAQHLSENPAARAEWEESHKLRNDPRITVIGKLLRETSLDEIPQLINVLLGDMSLVGPRPIVDAEIFRYGDDFRYYTAARPGITGLWQVSGRSNCSYARRVGYDVAYVSDWTLRSDLRILLRTILVVLKREGSC